MAGGDVNQNFPKSIRVKRGDDFSEILRKGPHAADDVLVVNVRRGKSPIDPTRIGITIPKKTGNAPIRNQWKRWIREAFRTQKDRIGLGLEVIVKPKRDAAGSFAAIRDSLPKAIARAAKKLPKQ